MNYFKEKAGARPTSIDENGYETIEQDGMALIDWFAGQILSGVMSDPEVGTIKPKGIYNIARRMMDERARLMEEEND